MKQACFKPGCWCTLEHNLEKLPGASGKICSRCGHNRFVLKDRVNDILQELVKRL